MLWAHVLWGLRAVRGIATQTKHTVKGQDQIEEYVLSSKIK